MWTNNLTIMELAAVYLQDYLLVKRPYMFYRAPALRSTQKPHQIHSTHSWQHSLPLSFLELFLYLPVTHSSFRIINMQMASPKGRLRGSCRIPALLPRSRPRRRFLATSAPGFARDQTKIPMSNLEHVRFKISLRGFETYHEIGRFLALRAFTESACTSSAEDQSPTYAFREDFVLASLWSFESRDRSG